MADGNGVKEFNLAELDELFKDESEPETPPAGDTAHSDNPPANDGFEGKEGAKAFAKRLRESTDKARAEERDNIAKALGYESYDDLQKKREQKMFTDKGLDPDEVSPIVEELVQKRLNEDPRMKELQAFKEQRAQEFAKKELEEVSKLTGGEIKSLDQVPQDVVERWKTTGSLKKAYLELHGEELIMKARAQSSRGTTTHLQPMPGSAPPVDDGKRPLTADERQVWKFFNPSMTDEELDKKRVEK